MPDLITRAAVKAIFETNDPLNQAAFIDLVDSLAINTEVAAKANSVSPAFTGTVVLPATTSIDTVSATELSYLNGVTSGIQSQFDAMPGSLDVSLTDDESATYVYYGGLVVAAWKVNRYHRTTFVKTSATIANNGGVATLAAAWTNRLTLVYA